MDNLSAQTVLHFAKQHCYHLQLPRNLCHECSFCADREIMAVMAPSWRGTLIAGGSPYRLSGLQARQSCVVMPRPSGKSSRSPAWIKQLGTTQMELLCSQMLSMLSLL